MNLLLLSHFPHATFFLHEAAETGFETIEIFMELNRFISCLGCGVGLESDAIISEIFVVFVNAFLSSGLNKFTGVVFSEDPVSKPLTN